MFRVLLRRGPVHVKGGDRMNRAGHQMSETLFLGALLTVTGGFLDAYT